MIILLLIIIALSNAAQPMNENVKYTIANANNPEKQYSFRDSSSFFEVRTSPINTTYGEVFWQMLPSVDLPKDIVDEYQDKYMIITGFEVDVRRVNESTGKEVSVPVYQSYNHHYAPAIHSSYAECLGDIGPTDSHGHPTLLYEVKGSPPEGTRLVTNFVHGNGNEHRQVYHGIPSGYGQILYSPSTFTLIPMQINTNDGTNRLGAGGPVPKFSRDHANLHGFYSPLLECPCTTRIQKAIGNLTSQLVGMCDVMPIASSDCFAGAFNLFQSDVVKNLTVESAHIPPGCSVSLDDRDGIVVTFNNNRSSLTACDVVPSVLTKGSSTSSMVKLNVSIDLKKDLVTIYMEGPSDVWFAVGFNASTMEDTPYTIVVSDKNITERKLSDHAAGTELKSSLKILSDNVSNDRRTVSMSRTLKGITTDHFTFDTRQGTIPFINAIGNSPSFGSHRYRAAASLTLLSQNVSCLCAGAQGKIDGYPLNANCVDEPLSDLLKTNNPTCTVSTYVGGLACCRHGTILLDAEQEPTRPKHIDSVFFRFRFYYQRNITIEDVKPVYHVEWAGNGCDSGLTGTNSHHCTHIEFDVTPSDSDTQTFKSDFLAEWMLGDTCATTSPQCMDKSQLGPSGKIELVMAAAHCHAPNCISQELIRTCNFKLEKSVEEEIILSNTFE